MMRQIHTVNRPANEALTLEGTAAALLDAAPHAWIVSNSDGAIVLVNTGAVTLFGYSREELLGKAVETILHERQRPQTMTPAATLARPLGVRTGKDGPSVAARRKDGSEIPVEVRRTPVASPRGTLTAAVIRDISAERGTEESLREAEERFSLALDQSPIGMALVGLDGRFLFVNRALCQIVGYSTDELTSLTFQDITHPDDLDVDLALLEQLRRGDIPSYQLSKRYIRKDGAIVDISMTRAVVRGRESQPLYYVTQMQDVTERMRMEAALRRSEAQLRDLFEQASEGIVVADLDGRFRDVNPAYCSIVGFTREELLEKRLVDLVPDEDADRFAAHRERLAVPGTVEVREWRARRKNGVLIDVEVSAKILADGRWQGFVHDISKRKAYEAERRRLLEMQRQQTRFLDTLVENIPAMIFVKDAEKLCFERVNRAAEHLLGWPREALIGKNDYDFFSEEQADFFQAKDRETLRSGRLVDIAEEPIQTRSGERWLRTMKIPLVGDDGRPTHLLGISIDITATKEAERERDTTMQWLRAVLDQSPIGILLSENKVGKPLALNDAARRLLGIKRETYSSDESLFCNAAGDPLAQDETPLRQALRGRRIESVELHLRRHDADLVPVIVGASPVRDGQGAIMGAVAIAYDATSIKELERLRGEWNATVAHDLRQPLTTILLQVRLLAEQNKDFAELHSAMERIQRSVLRLDRMVGDLLDLSRLEAGRLSIARKPVDLPALTRSCVNDVASGAGDRSFELEVRGKIPLVEADPDRVSQILHNLLSNAVKYGASGTPIVVTIEGEDGQVSVAITNEGPGIAAEEFGNLFQPFRRTKNARLSGIEGVGLGLFITRALVEAHGGRLDVASAIRGTTTFRFTLPIIGFLS